MIFALIRIFNLAFAAYLVFLPTTGVVPDLSWHNDQRLAQIALLLLVAVHTASGLIFVGSSKVAAVWSLTPRYVRIALAAVLLLGMVSAAVAPLPRWALLEWSLMALLLALGMLVAVARHQLPARFDRLLMAALLLTAAAYILKVAVAYSAALVERLPLNIGWLLDGFSNPRFFSQFQSMTLPLLVLPAMYWARTPLSRLSLTLIPVFWWMLAITSGGRGTWLAMLSACTLVLICAKTHAYRWLKWQLGTFVAGAAAYGLFFYAIPGLRGVQADTVNRLVDIASLSFRDVLWKRAMDFIVANPILGIGPMHFSYYPNPVAAHPHMSLLQWAAEWGILSALLVLGIAMYAGWCYARKLRAAMIDNEESHVLRLALLGSLCAAAVHSLVDGIIVMPYSQTLLAVLCGWALALHHSRSPLMNNLADRPVLPIIFLAVALSAALLVWGAAPGVMAIFGGDAAFSAHVVQEGGILMPRFWSDGWIYR